MLILRTISNSSSSYSDIQYPRLWNLLQKPCCYRSTNRNRFQQHDFRRRPESGLLIYVPLICKEALTQASFFYLCTHETTYFSLFPAAIGKHTASLFLHQPYGHQKRLGRWILYGYLRRGFTYTVRLPGLLPGCSLPQRHPYGRIRMGHAPLFG